MRNASLRRNGLVLAAMVAVAAVSYADVKLHGLFTDNMVLQQGKTVPVWGQADKGERVTVAFLGQVTSGIAEHGKWVVKLAPMKPGGPYVMTITGKTKIELKNVLVGEVWVASGQSNMNMRVASCANATEEIAKSENPMIRSYTVPRLVAAEPQTDVKAAWQMCGPKTVGSFSGAAYFFARELQKARQVPVGIIHTSWGGTPSEAWTSLPKLQATPEAKSILDRYEGSLEKLPERMEKYEQALAKFNEDSAKLRKEGKRINWRLRPRMPYGPEHPHRPAGLYNGMIAPLIPYAVAGAIWYQGESNRSRAHQYRVIFPAMIQDWRANWGQGDLPFFWVQLAAFRGIDMEPQNSEWAELQEAQTLTLSLPKTGMAVAVDIGDESDIHPKRKQEVGARLALAARAVAYGEQIVYSGPMYESMQTRGGKVEITFTHAGSGLVARGDGLNAAQETGLVRRARAANTGGNEKQASAFATKAQEEVAARTRALAVRNVADQLSTVKGFTICGPDRKFVWANAKIVAPNKVVVSSTKIANPIAVRYAWANYPVCNLYNKERLPAVPFRTDDFPMLTAPKPGM